MDAKIIQGTGLPGDFGPRVFSREEYTMKNYIIAALAVTNLATCARFHWQGEPYKPQEAEIQYILERKKLANERGDRELMPVLVHESLADIKTFGIDLSQYPGYQDKDINWIDTSKDLVCARYKNTATWDYQGRVDCINWMDISER